MCLNFEILVKPLFNCEVHVSDSQTCVLKDNSNYKAFADQNSDTVKHIINANAGGGGSRTGLFRTPISGGVQSATSAHGLPRPALAVRNLMEQVIFDQ